MTEPEDNPEEGATEATDDGGAQESQGANEAPGSPQDAPAEPAGPTIDDIRAERARLKDQLLRTAADFDNFRKRSRRDVEDAARRGKEDALREILPVIDNLERALGASAAATDVAAVLDGVRMVLRLFEDTSQRMGLLRVRSVGERFDPNVHDAVQQLETDDHPAGTIVAEIVPGYIVGDRLLRAAMVVVARPAPKPSPEDEAANTDPPPEPDSGASADAGAAEASDDGDESAGHADSLPVPDLPPDDGDAPADD